MNRALSSILSLAILASPAFAAECPPVERTPGPPVYAILYGYPYSGPGGQLPNDPDPPLEMVDDDVMRMARFFQALGPRQMYVHGEPSRELLARFSAFGVRPPTWRSLRQSVAELVYDIDREGDSAEGEPQIYVYLAGHGRRYRGPHGSRLMFFGRPDGMGPGYNGMLNSALFAEHVLTPLAARGRVHVIADTCFSYVLLQTRGMKLIKRVIKAPPREFYEEAFGKAFPDVGALLASRSAAYEGRERAGHFTHALRSAAVGLADTNSDGVITYGEMDRALALAAESDRGLRGPTAIGPGLDPDAPFIRWDHSPAARVCAPPGAAVKIFDGPDLFATLPDRFESVGLWLPAGHAFTVGDVSFEAAESDWVPLIEAPAAMGR